MDEQQQEQARQRAFANLREQQEREKAEAQIIGQHQTVTRSTEQKAPKGKKIPRLSLATWDKICEFRERKKQEFYQRPEIALIRHARDTENFQRLAGIFVANYEVISTPEQAIEALQVARRQLRGRVSQAVEDPIDLAQTALARGEAAAMALGLAL